MTASASFVFVIKLPTHHGLPFEAAAIIVAFIAGCMPQNQPDDFAALAEMGARLLCGSVENRHACLAILTWR